MKPEELVKLCPGIRFMPLQANKRPLHEGWRDSIEEYNFNQSEFIGILCGIQSGNIEAIDFDLKYDLTGTLYKRYKKAVAEAAPGLLEKMVVQKTRSGGFHFVYRCSEVEGNTILAKRHTTDEEKQAKPGAKANVLLETRGTGGYIVCAPSPGYELIHGSFDKVQTITPEERGILFDIAREFNEYFAPVYVPKIKPQQKSIKGLSPFEDYNQRGDVVALLVSHNWEIVNQRGSRTYVKRPGNSDAKHSGNYDSEKNWFSVFSTSTEFEPETPYLPYAVFVILECNGDFSLGSKKLFDMGYGDRREVKANECKGIATVPQTVDTGSRDFSKDIAPLSSLWNKMEYEFINGKPKGETTCFKSIDPKFTWFRGDVNVFAGHNNHGKSEIALQMMLVKAVINGYKWGVFCPENLPETYFYDCLIESYIGKSVDKDFSPSMTIEEYKRGYDFIKKHFILVNPEGKADVDNLLSIFQFLIDNYQVDGVMIDPWNSLEHEDGKREDQYLRTQLVKIKKFTTQNNIFFVITAHPKTMAKVFETGEYKIPDQNDLAGGAMWGHKTDNVIAIHRPNYHESKTSTEVHFISHKIKKQKQVGLPGTAKLFFDRKTRRYQEEDGNTPLHTIEVTEIPKEVKGLPDKPVKDYLDAFEFKQKAKTGAMPYQDDLNAKGPEDAPF